MPIEEPRITLPVAGLAAAFALVAGGLAAAQAAAPARVVLDTSAGQIEIEVDQARAPHTAALFLRYVDRGLFDDAVFLRVVRAPARGQGDAAVALVEAEIDPSHREEALRTAAAEQANGPGVPREPGSVALIPSARDARVSDLAFCLTPSGGATTLDPFGTVVRGLDIVRRIGQGPTHGQRLVQTVRILRARRVHEE